MQESIRIIESEHRTISSVLHALKELTRMAGDPSMNPEFKAFRAVVRYVDEYPERIHHPKEDMFLFARLAAVYPEALGLIRRLTAEHTEGARLIRDLERALMIFEDGWPEGWREFADLVDRYVNFHWNHMRLEEQEILPLALKHFSPQDWAYVNEGFASNNDPLAKVDRHDFQAMFTRLVNLAPAPVGLGDPWRRESRPPG